MKPNPARAAVVLGPLSMLALTAVIIYHSGGSLGFRAFLNLEAIVFVLAGTFLLMWTAYPVSRWQDADAAAYGAQCAMAMGGLGTLLGMILMLARGDLSLAPQRMALSLSALFFGILLSKAFFLPLSRRAERVRVRGN